MAILHEIKRKLDKDADNETISDEVCEKYRWRLLQFECNFLKNQSTYLKPYVGRDKENTM